MSDESVAEKRGRKNVSELAHSYIDDSAAPRRNCSLSAHRLSDGASEFLTTRMAKESSLVMVYSTNRGQLVGSKLVAPLATVALGSPINRDGLAKCIIWHFCPPLLRRSRHLMCFSIFMQHVEFIMPLSVALVSFRFVWFQPVSLW
jgi:hypothetical protein